MPWRLVCTVALIVFTGLFLFGGPLREIASKRAFDRALKSTVRKGVTTAARADAIADMSTDELKRTARVLHYGVPGNRTSGGSYVEGVEPRPVQAARAYDLLVERGQADVYLDYASLLEFGVPGEEHLVDPHKALVLRKMHFVTLTDPYARYEALEAIERLSPPHERALASVERSMLARRIVAASPGYVVPAASARSPASGLQEQGFRVDTPRPIRTTGEDIWVLPADGIRAHDERAGGATVRNDAHNAHDSGVTKTVKASIERLRKAVGGRGVDDTSALREVRCMIIGSDVPEDKKGRAISALDTLERNNQMMGSAGVTEVELMGLVWNRIHHEDNAGSTGVLRENLVDELSEAIEHGKHVCASGRFNRVLDTLNGVDEVVQIKPKWAIQRELVDRAGAIYKEQVGVLPATEKEAVCAMEPSVEQEEICERVMATIKETIKDDFAKSYVDQGIMTQQDLEVEVSRFIDDIA